MPQEFIIIIVIIIITIIIIIFVIIIITPLATKHQQAYNRKAINETLRNSCSSQ